MSSLWVESHKPRNLGDVVLLPELKAKFEKIIEEMDIRMPILLYGSPGHGKTTILDVICLQMRLKSKNKADIFMMNGSNKTSIDDIRNESIPFANTQRKKDAPKKVIFIDEFDRLSVNALDLLKDLIQRTWQNCSYIFATNYIHKIPEPVQSRCSLISLLPSDDEKIYELKKLYYKRMVKILKEENVEYDKKVLSKHIGKTYPDFRKTVILAEDAYMEFGCLDDRLLDLK